MQQQSELSVAIQELKPREREMLWLAYAQGSNHKEIAEVLGLNAGSIRLMLFRARKKMATFLRRKNLAQAQREGCNAARETGNSA